MNELYTLITGGSSGIGLALAIECASRGMNLLLVALPGKELNEVAQKIAQQYSVKVNVYDVDLSEADAPQRVYKWCTDNQFSVNILINNAGVTGTSVFRHSDIAYCNNMVLVNVRAMVLLTRLFIPLLGNHKNAYILNIASFAAFFYIPYKSVYAASKAFVYSFSNSLRIELENSGISVSVACPSGVETNHGTLSRIKSHGFFGKLTKIDAAQLAGISIEGMLKRKAVIVPRRINRLIIVINMFLPDYIRRQALKRRFRKELQACNAEPVSAQKKDLHF